ncbi:hypothetical protein OROGR_019112 [Orobanche gracilis]
MINKVKVSGKKPNWMEQPEYEAWLTYWHRSDVENVSYKNSQNRLSVPVDGNGVAKYHFVQRLLLPPNWIKERRIPFSISSKGRS